MLRNNFKAILSVAAILSLMTVLGLAVWRVSNQRTVVQRPKATANTRQCSGNPFCTDCMPCSNNDDATLNVSNPAGYCADDNTCEATKKCVNNACVDPCTTPAPVCKQNVAANHACTQQNVADGTACTGGTCQAGTCVLPPTRASECEVCEGFAGTLCASGLTCKKVANPGPDQGGICVKTNGTTTCNTCTTDNNCVEPLVCADGTGGKKCTDPANIYGVCVIASDNAGTCQRFRGPLITTVQIPGACSNYGQSCQITCTGAGDCPSGLVCKSGKCSIPACQSNSNCDDNKACKDNECVTPVCLSTATVCQTTTYTGHVCNITNKADGTTCADSSTDVGITTGGVCQANGTTTSKCKCTSSSTCASGKTCELYTGKTFGECKTSTSSEASTCWGNQGASGKCYDCDGNGVINVLDFSCFRKHYGVVVTP